MVNSESPTRISPDRQGSGTRLVDVATGQLVVVTGVDAEHAASLALEGIRVGVELSVERRLVLGGPLIVRLGRARMAIARSVAAGLLVAPAGERAGC
jgi:Fe2+ transport system protein FeoA